MIFEVLNIVSKEDEDAILEIAGKSIYISLTKNLLRHYINDKFHKIAVAKEDERIKGFIIYFILPPDIDIIFIASYPNAKGYGSYLIDKLVEEASRSKVSRITLDLHENNNIAKTFYEHKGFSDIAIRARYYDNFYDAVIMEMLL